MYSDEQVMFAYWLIEAWWSSMNVYLSWLLYRRTTKEPCLCEMYSVMEKEQNYYELFCGTSDVERLRNHATVSRIL